MTARPGDARLGLWLFVITDAMSFAGLLLAYAVLRVGAASWPSTAQAFGPGGLALAGVATGVLLGSSVTVRIASSAARRGHRPTLLTAMVITALLGAGFLALQGHEYSQLISHGAGLSTSSFHASFFATTGFHGLHVLAGVVWMLILLGRVTGEDSAGTGAAAPLGLLEIYWQFVDAIWVVIFLLYYVSQSR